MGGSLFKAERIPESDYQDLINICRQKFADVGRKTLFPESFHNKKDHGDLDIIIEGPVIPKEELQKLFDLRPEWVSQNSSVISVFYQGKYQIDCCFHSSENFLSAYQYNRGSDCGNLIGRIANHLGFSFGHSGLLYKINLSDVERIGEISISRDIKEILAFFDLDYQKWSEGFQDQEDLFLWMANSKYFNPRSYQFENLTHTNRVRNRKRPVFAAFVEWINKQTFPERPKVNKSELFFAALVHFRKFDILDEVKLMLIAHQRKKDANLFFNGHMAMEMSGWKGKELGAALVEFRRKIHCESDEEWVNARLTRPEDVKDAFSYFCLTNQKTSV